MGRRGAPVAVTIISLAVAGCVATTPFYTSEKLERGGAPPRVVLMPPDVQLSELTAGGLLEPKAEWTAKAEKHITAAIRELMQEREARLVVYDPASGGSDKDARTQLIKLHGAVGMSILVHKYLSPQQLPTKEGKFDWSLGPQARLLGDEYDADYALFIFIRDSYTSGGRAFAIFAAALFGVGLPGGVQTGFASLVDLKTGQVEWFNFLRRGEGDLRTQEAARKSIDALLKKFPL